MSGVKKGNIALFVPHNGCPHQCSFCNQKSITGVQYQPTENDVKNAVETALSGSKKYDREIAFFGGSFTAIERGCMTRLLKAASVYVKNGSVSGIRISTRPDAIDEDVLAILKSYGVTAIELGAQSMDDSVLTANLRGHTSKDVENASRMIKEYGFSLGLQMMTGLYKNSREKDITTAKKIIALAPDTVRIYPTVTLRGTLLGELFESGKYKPDTLAQSVDLCALLLKMFRENNIEVIRLGLHYSDELVRGTLFDNYHPAFRELCESRLMLDEFMRVCKESGIIGGNVTAYVHPSCVSKFIGQRKENIIKLNGSGFTVKTIADENIDPFEVRVFKN